MAAAARLVVLAPNWLGDAVMALPAIADIRRTWPDAAITVAARASVASLFALVPTVNRTIVLPAKGSASDTAAVLRDDRFEAAILLPNSFHIALAMRRAGVPERWGYRRDWRGRLLTKAVRRPDGVHQAEYYQRLVRELGCTNGAMRPQLVASPDVRTAGVRALASAGWDGRSTVVALAPGAAYGGAKRWPAASFAEVAARLSEEGGASIALIGAPADAGAGADVEALLRGAANKRARRGLFNLIGRTDLPTLAGVLTATRGLVTNDSGAMHFAAALGVPVTAMFGPTREHETRPLAAPDAPEPVVLTHDVWCRPCMLRECPLTHRCMRGIAPAAVVAAARRAL
jgi:heptosyltransferase-2